MNVIIFYKDQHGNSEVLDFLETLREKASRNKDAKIQYKQITFLIELLRIRGTMLPENYSKCLGNGLWELRPGCNRILYFLETENEFVLLHHFRKRTQKTPKRELDKARSEMIDYLSRKENGKIEND